MDMACSMGMDMDYGNGYAALKWTRSTDFAAWIWTVDMHGVLGTLFDPCRLAYLAYTSND